MTGPAPHHQLPVADDPTGPPERATYTVAEVATLLGISAAVVYDLLNRGQIPARRLGSRWIIARHRFHTWLNTTDEPTDAPATNAGGHPIDGIPRPRTTRHRTDPRGDHR